MGQAINEANIFKRDLSKKELAERTCAKCGVFDIAHNDAYRGDPDVEKIPCKKFVKPKDVTKLSMEVKKPGEQKEKKK